MPPPEVGPAPVAWLKRSPHTASQYTPCPWPGLPQHQWAQPGLLLPQKSALAAEAGSDRWALVPMCPKLSSQQTRPQACPAAQGLVPQAHQELSDLVRGGRERQTPQLDRRERSFQGLQVACARVIRGSTALHKAWTAPITSSGAPIVPKPVFCPRSLEGHDSVVQLPTEVFCLHQHEKGSSCST